MQTETAANETETEIKMGETLCNGGCGNDAELMSVDGPLCRDCARLSDGISALPMPARGEE